MRLCQRKRGQGSRLWLKESSQAGVRLKIVLDCRKQCGRFLLQRILLLGLSIPARQGCSSLYNRGMNSLLISLLKFAGSLWHRFRNWQVLADTWEAAEIHGRVAASNPMEGAGLTRIALKAPWSNTFEAHAYDINADGSHREHESEIIPDPHNPLRFRRTVRYKDSVEVSHQWLEVIGPNMLLVIPDEPDYHRHVLRRVKGSLLIN